MSLLEQRKIHFLHVQRGTVLFLADQYRLRREKFGTPEADRFINEMLDTASDIDEDVMTFVLKTSIKTAIDFMSLKVQVRAEIQDGLHEDMQKEQVHALGALLLNMENIRLEKVYPDEKPV